MKDIDLILPLINQYAPGCPYPTAMFALRQAAIDFAERTRTWRAEETLSVAQNETKALTPTAGAVVFDIETLLFDGHALEPKAVAWLDENMEGWRAGSLVGLPAYFTQTEPNTFRLAPVQAGQVVVYYWLKPSQSATQLPDFMIDQYRETLSHGALARILSIPGQPFSNPSMAANFGSLFASKLDSLSRQGSRGQQRARVRTRASFM